MNTATATILTVEDDPIVRSELRLVLEDAGYDVCADARDGIEAVALARWYAPDLILLDLGLPRLDGVQAARRILQERRVPIVALTGRSPRFARKALEAGAVSCLRKPFAAGEVVDTVAEALAARHEHAREESRAAIAQVLGLMGYPATMAAELEEDEYRRGYVWRRNR